MKVSAALVSLALAGYSAAQFTALPKCAQSCADAMINGNGYAGCGSDVKCICSNKDFISNVACCLAGTCDAADQAQAVTFAQQLCSAQGVSVPSAVASACPSTASTQASTGSSGSVASVPATTTASTSGSVSTAAAQTSSSSGGSSSSGSATVAATTGAASSSSSKAWAPRPTAMAGAGAIGGLVAAIAML